jgi:hypothetical protein
MKAILGFIASFLIVMFVFSCSGKKSFEGSEDFESGKYGTLFGPGGPGTTVWISPDPERVINGKFSAYSKSEPYRGEWWEFLYSDRKKLALERKGAYTVTFNKKRHLICLKGTPVVVTPIRRICSSEIPVGKPTHLYKN